MAEEFSDKEKQMSSQLARLVVERRMSTPALLWLESTRPLNFMGSQFLHFFNPALGIFLPFDRLDAFARMLEKRGAIDLLIKEIEREEEDHRRKLREEKAQRKKAKTGGTGGQ